MSQTTQTREVILTSDAKAESWSAAVWDPRNGSLLSAFKNASALGHRGLRLLSDSYALGADPAKPRIHIWPLNSPSPVPNVRLTTPGKVNALTCTPNGAYLIVAVSEKLFVWQTCNGRFLAGLAKHYQTVCCLSVTKDGSLFASGGEDGLVFVWSLYSAINDKQSSPVHSFSNHTLPVRDLHFGHGIGGRARLYTISLDRTANIYELGSGTLLLSLVFDAPLTALAVNVRDSDLFVGLITGDISQCNLHEAPRGIEHHVAMNAKDGDAERAVFKAHKSNVTALSVSVSCRTLLSGSTDGAVHLWDIASRQVLRTIEHKGPVTAAFFAPGYENFRASALRPRLEVCNLQVTSDVGGRESVLKVISRGRDPSEILDFDSYVQDNVDPLGLDEASKKLDDMNKEIKKLKKVNHDLYKYSLRLILNIKDDTIKT